ncbi:MAG TPA: SufE family protein, partial [Bacteroidales bacterium]|nr:SufE family protein [Bacteroidales bacterium]
MTIKEVQDSIIDEFSMFDDWMDKYNLLIDLGKELPVIDPKYKVKDFLIEGCQSKVWL